MTGYDITIFLIVLTGIVCYLWGYTAGARFTLEEMNKQIEAKLKEKDC
jgi:hypothetical protein